MDTYMDTLFLTLQWFPIAHRIRTKLFTMTYQACIIYLWHSSSFSFSLPSFTMFQPQGVVSAPWTRQLCSYHWASALADLIWNVFPSNCFVNAFFLCRSQPFSLPQPTPFYHFTLLCLLHSTYQLQKLYYVIYTNVQYYSFPSESNPLKTGTLIYIYPLLCPHCLEEAMFPRW